MWGTRLCLIFCGLLMVPFPGFSNRVEAANRMYWTDAASGKVQRANLDGSGVETLVTTAVNPVGIALDVAGGKMYWAEGDGLKIRRANLNGSGVQDLVGSVGPVGIALDVAGGKVYWTDVFVTGSIQRANLDGSGVENLITALCDCEGIALDVPGGKMYFTDRTFDRIRRANLDGSGLENLVTTGLSDPRGIALDLAGGKMYWTELGTRKIRHGKHLEAQPFGARIQEPRGQGPALEHGEDVVGQQVHPVPGRIGAELPAQISGGSGNLVRRNDAHGNTVGIQLDGNGNTASGNNSHTNSLRGITVSGDGNEIKGNKISRQNTGIGLDPGADGNIVAENDITSNPGAGVLSQRTSITQLSIG